MPVLRKVAVVVSACVLANFAFAQDEALPKGYSSPREAFKAFEKSDDSAIRAHAYEWMLEVNSRDLNEALPFLSKMAETLERDADFERFCATKILEENPDVTLAVVTKLSDWYTGRGDDEKALNALTSTLNSDLALTPSQRASLASKAASILTGKMLRYAEAVEILSDAIDTVSSKDPEIFASLANTQSGIFLNNLADADAAEARTREVLALGERCPGTAFATASEQLASILLDKGDKEGAVEAYMRTLKHFFCRPKASHRKLFPLGMILPTLKNRFVCSVAV